MLHRLESIGRLVVIHSKSTVLFELKRFSSIVILILINLSLGCSFNNPNKSLTQSRISPQYFKLKKLSEPEPLPPKVSLALSTTSWQGSKWTNQITLINPKNLRSNNRVILVVDNHQLNSKQRDILLNLASGTNSKVAHVADVPNQPLFGKKEGDLLAYSFKRYLKSSNNSWPLIYPMVSVIRSSVELINKVEKPDSIIVIGSSKRAWATLLAAAVLNNKVKGVISLSFNMLNFDEQILALKRDGLPKQLIPYAFLTAKPSKQLIWLKKNLDPFSYRDQLLQPKLFLSGANDPYWNSKSSSYFINQLKGRTCYKELPGLGHNIFEHPHTQKYIIDWINKLNL